MWSIYAARNLILFSSMYSHWSKNDVDVKENYIGLFSALNYIVVVFFIGDKSNNILKMLQQVFETDKPISTTD